MLRKTALIATAAALVFAVVGCSSATSTGAGPNSAASQKAEKALEKVAGQVFSKGPNGEDPSPASAADLSADEIAKVKALGATAAIVMHYGGNDWATAQIAGLKSEFGKLGIKVVATTDADFKPDKQVSDLETVLAQKPSIIVSIPTDPVATASAYKAAAASGAKLVFMDNVPQGLKAGTDYVSVVSADNYGNGVVSAHEMAKALGGKGTIGTIFHQADFFVTKQRYRDSRTRSPRSTRTSRSWRRRGSPVRTSRETPRPRPTRCSASTRTSPASGPCGTSRLKA